MALAERREAARAARDFGAADGIRAEIEQLGWTVADGPEGFTLKLLASPGETYDGYAAVPPRSGASTCRHSVCIAYHGWPSDIARLVRRLAAGDGAEGVEVLLVSGPGAEEPAAVLEAAGARLARLPLVVNIHQAMGHAQLLNVAARRSRGQFVHFVEPSLEFGVEVLEAAAATLDDPAVGAAGPFALTTEDWREFHPTTGDDILALEYLVSIRGADLGRIGEMDPGYRFYRNLDLDYSRQVAATGMSLRRYEATVGRHVHRLWEATPEVERERLSRRNFNRLLARWVRGGGPAS